MINDNLIISDYNLIKSLNIFPDGYENPLFVDFRNNSNSHLNLNELEKKHDQLAYSIITKLDMPVNCYLDEEATRLCRYPLYHLFVFRMGWSYLKDRNKNSVFGPTGSRLMTIELLKLFNIHIIGDPV